MKNRFRTRDTINTVNSERKRMCLMEWSTGKRYWEGQTRKRQSPVPLRPSPRAREFFLTVACLNDHVLRCYRVRPHSLQILWDGPNTNDAAPRSHQYSTVGCTEVTALRQRTTNQGRRIYETERKTENESICVRYTGHQNRVLFIASCTFRGATGNINDLLHFNTEVWGQNKGFFFSLQ